MAIPIQDQVCLLDQAKKLKELGVRTRSQFDWKEFEHKKTKEIKVGWTFGGVGEWYSLKSYNILNSYGAWNVAELGLMIGSGYYTSLNQDNTWNCFDWHDNAALYVDFPTEAQARSSLLIHLLETGVLKIEDVNKRLNQ